MASFNQVILIGYLTRDPELRYTTIGTAVAKFGIAVNRVWTTESGEKKEEVTFVDVDCFGKTAENVAQYLKKGRQAMVEGRLKLDQWEDKQSGQKRQKLGVVCERVLFLGGDGGEQRQPAARSAAPAKAPAAPVAGDEPPDGDDVPFR